MKIRERSDFVRRDLENADIAPDIYVDGYQGALVTGSVVKINFFSDYSHGESIHRKVVARVCIPIDSLRGVVSALTDLLKDIDGGRDSEISQ
ncbi:MAG: hypothetical protein ABT940_01190 [Alphaproteobacteria bacterium]